MQARQQIRTVDLAILRENIRLVRQTLPPGTALMAVIKADAYGHGMEQCARAARQAGAEALAVARVSEGVALRDAGAECPVLVLGAASPEEAVPAILHKLDMTVCTAEAIRAAGEAARRLNRPARVQLKLDTGMSRIGVRTQEEIGEALKAMEDWPEVHLTGAFTHFADADGEDEAFTREQLRRFRELTALLPQGIALHCANSAAIHRFPEATTFSMVRLGISMYGYPPVKTDLPLQPVMDWRTCVTFVKEIAPGDAVSYGCTFRADRPLRIATVACGYGDGYHRAAGGRAQVIIRGQRAPIVGRICMDQMMADVSHIPGVQPGDEVILLGTDGRERITAEDIAAWAGTISYEVLLAATGRVERVWRHAWLDKPSLRSALVSKKDPLARRQESVDICANIVRSEEFRRARVVAGYMPLEREADILPVLMQALAQGKEVLLPRMEEAPQMTLRRVKSTSELWPGRFGVKEPGPDAPVAAPQSCDLMLVPLEALDAQGMRLGKGAGYYDTMLAQLPPDVITMGCPLSWQWVQDIPADPWDYRLTAACDRQGIRYFNTNQTEK